MRIRSNIILLLTLASVAGGCIYSNNETYTVEPVAGDPAVVTVSTSLDTMNVPSISDSSFLEVAYTMHVENGKPYYVDGYVELSTVYELGIYYSYDAVYILHPDSVFEVLTDTFYYPDSLDAIISFVRDTLAGSYTLEGSFRVPGSLPVTPGEHSLNLDFYYSSNTNSLADILGIEAEVSEKEFILNFTKGSEE